MRTTKRLQLFLRPAKIETTFGDELEEMGRILNEAPGINELYKQVALELSNGKSKKSGRNGLTAEQVIKLGILRARHGANYRELAHLTSDSMSVRAFLDLPPGVGLKRSTINYNLKCLSEDTWLKLNECLKTTAQNEGIEDGASLRGDTTTTRTNIHFPTDASLLLDAMRVLTRAMNRLKELGIELKSSDHYRRAKKKVYKINNTRNPKIRQACYLELIRVTRMTLGYAEKAVEDLKTYKMVGLDILTTFIDLESQLKHYIPLAKQVLDQSYRRIVKRENVPAAEKIFSIFEPETDIIIKGQRDIVFGHKVYMATGKSSLILQLTTLDGNPADSSLVEQSLKEHKRFYKSAPENVAFDGGFASVANRDIAKAEGVVNITFSKNGSMQLDTLVDSAKTHKSLLRFRAGIEGCISFFKRIFGGTKVVDRTKETFKSALQCGAAAYNLILIARHRLRLAVT